MEDSQSRQRCGAARAVPRKMVSAELMGAHSHHTQAGTSVHIYRRDGKYLARGRYERRAFGETLGADERAAVSRLRELLTEIEKRSYVVPKESRRRRLGRGVIPQLDLRELVDQFLAEKRKTRGAATAQDYQNRLSHCLDFAERPDCLKRWPLARDLTRDFVVELRQFLTQRKVTRNGRPGGVPKLMSPRHVRNCLEALRTTLAWSLRADVRKLPPEFVNPVTDDLLGPKPQKDPLRKSKLPHSRRIELIRNMDEWELLHLSTSMILPLRFEDVAGALISDVDFDNRMMRFGTRFIGSDFNKERLTVLMPLPWELLPILRACSGDRTEGPLFRSRPVWLGRKRPGLRAASRGEMETLVQRTMDATPSSELQTPQDRKLAIRALIRRLGGLSEQQVSKGLKAVFDRCGVDERVRPYDVRHSVTTEIKDSGVRHLELRYLTLHSVNDILNEYTGLDPAGEIQKYFDYCKPLLTAVLNRADDLGILTVPQRAAG